MSAVGAIGIAPSWRSPKLVDGKGLTRLGPGSCNFEFGNLAHRAVCPKDHHAPGRFIKSWRGGWGGKVFFKVNLRSDPLSNFVRF